jgi:hypothetical protein
MIALPRRIGIAAVSVLASLLPLIGCGSQGGGSGEGALFTNRTYWKEFFGPGVPGRDVGVSVTAASGGSGSSAAASVQSPDSVPTRIEDNVALMQQLFHTAGGYIDDFLNVEERHHTVTAKLLKDVDRIVGQTGKAPNEEAQARLSEIIARAAASLDEQRSKVQLAQSLFDDKAKPIMAAAADIEQTCTKANKDPDLATACPRFEEALSLTRVKLEILATGFAHTAGVYQEEHRAIESLAQRFRQAR